MADDQITIRWSGGEREFGPGLVRLGRDPSNEVVIDNPNVSRHHGELRFGPSGWTYADVGSAQGTFADGASVTTKAVAGPIALSLGRGAGERVELNVVTEARTQARSATVGAVMGFAAPDATVVVGAERNRPGGALRADQVQGATVVTGHAINVECGGRSYSFSPGQDVSIGRDIECDIVSANPTVSRHHADLRYQDGSWTLADRGSSGGTFVDGRRVKDLRLTGSTAAWLGEIDTGERLVLVTSGAHARSSSERVVRAARKKTPIIVVGAVAALAVVVAAVALVRPGGGTAAPSNDRLAKAVVRIDLDGFAAGSGTVIDAKRGLILTNAHVAAPRALGEGVRYGTLEVSLPADPRLIVIAVSPGLDKVAEPTYVARVVASDGYLDLAVLKITGTVGGAVVESSDLERLADIEIGDSDALRTGSAIRVFGFPAISDSKATTLTEGVVSGPVKDPRLGSNQAFLNLDALIRGGNSGGLAADQDGRLVGVPTLLRELGDETPVSSMRPVNFAADLIKAARDDKPYTSPFVTALSGSEEFANFGIVGAARDGFEPTCATPSAPAAAGASVVALAFDYKGFAAQQLQDVRIDVYRPDNTLIGTVVTKDQWPYQWSETGCATATIQLKEALSRGTYVAVVFAGPNYQVLNRVEIPVS